MTSGIILKTHQCNIANLQSLPFYPPWARHPRYHYNSTVMTTISSVLTALLLLIWVYAQVRDIEAIIICLIQYFEADFLWKVSLKILNSGIILKTHQCNIAYLQSLPFCPPWSRHPRYHYNYTVMTTISLV